MSICIYASSLQVLDINYSPFKLQGKEEDIFSIVTDYANESWERTPSEPVGLNFIHVNSVQTSDDTAEEPGLATRRETPSSTDSSAQADKDHSKVEGEVCSKFESNEDDGKGHILSKFLTDINSERNGFPHGVTFQTENTSEDIGQDRSSVSSPTTLAQVVAHRMVGVANSGANSSGYGTADGYNCSDVSEVSKTYLAQKLQDVEDAGVLCEDETVVISILNSVERAGHTVCEESSHSQTNTPSPPLDCTKSADIHAADDRTLEVMTDSTCVLARNSAYYEDEKGYLHLGPWKTGHSSGVAKSL